MNTNQYVFFFFFEATVNAVNNTQTCGSFETNKVTKSVTLWRCVVVATFIFLKFNLKYYKLRTSICGDKYIQVMHACN